MASASVIDQTVIPSLHIAPTVADLKHSSNLYNQLPSDEVQPALLPSHSQEVRNISIQHNVQHKFGIHLIHDHFEIPKDRDIIFESPSGCWTKPIPIEDVHTVNVYGHIFKLSTDGKLVAYEYREGSPTNVSEIDPSFFEEIFKFLLEHNLTDILGLQALGYEPILPMIELVLGNVGTVMLNEAQAQYGGIYRTTGWCIGRESESQELQDGEKHPQTTRGNHLVFIHENPPSDIGELKSFLKKAEIIM
ncbi:hypothetical protein N7463_010107 [Penicillium fimorum]|uniref:Uncharacterized protein n=1 Tax=Penicillium fimorum TaxID=1882269 RepID=A0A9X0C1D3_9EURO|nr:hypothetical protein N7463_010107 [Penicillium fimorum]